MSPPHKFTHNNTDIRQGCIISSYGSSIGIFFVWELNRYFYSKEKVGTSKITNKNVKPLQKHKCMFKIHSSYNALKLHTAFRPSIKKPQGQNSMCSQCMIESCLLITHEKITLVMVNSNEAFIYIVGNLN